MSPIRRAGGVVVDVSVSGRKRQTDILQIYRLHFLNHFLFSIQIMITPQRYPQGLWPLFLLLPSVHFMFASIGLVLECVANLSYI